MGTVSVSTSLGEKFNITFTNGNSYDLDSIFDAKARLSQKALVVEVKRNQAVAQRALKQLESDLTRNISSSLNREDVIASVNDIIVSVFNVYGRESGSAPFAIQLIDSKITNYLQTVLNRTDIYFDITIYDNKANIEYSLPNDFIRGKFTEYYNNFSNKYSTNMAVSTGGLAISDKAETFTMSNSDYDRYLYTEPSNNYYNSAHGSCSSNDVHWHQCGCDNTTSGDIGNLDFITNPENIALINELKKVFLSKKSASEKLETKYIRADKGYFKKIYVDDDLVMKNIAVTGNLSGSTVSGDTVIVGDVLRVDSGIIELSGPDGHFYEVFLDKDTGSLVLHSRVAGSDTFKRVAAIDSDSESGHVFYNSETKSYEVRNLSLDDYYTKSETDSKIAEEISKQVHFGIEICDVLPDISEGKTGTVYLIPDEESLSGVYTEYVFVPANADKEAHFEKIGTTRIDLTNYYTKSETDQLIRDALPTKVSDLDNDSGYLTSIPDEYVTESEIGIAGIPEIKDENDNVTQESVPGTGIYEQVYSKAEIDELLRILDLTIKNTYITQTEVSENYATNEKVETVVTETVKEEVTTKVEEVVTGENSQVDAVQYIDFDELEG